MKLQSFTSFIVLITLSAAIFCACKKNNDAKTNLQVTGITPDSGRYSTIVTITGTGFSTNAPENQVKFNGKDAVVQTATPSQLTVVVPKGAGTGPLSITVGNKSTTGPSFSYILTVTVSTLAESATLFAYGLATDDQGNIYNYGPIGNITKITQEEEVSSFAQEMSGYGGFGITADTHQNIYASASDSCYIFKITPEGVVSTLAGDGRHGFADGQTGLAKFNSPMGIAADTSGNIYVADFGNNRIRKITPAGAVSTLAGDGVRGFADGTDSSAHFYSPFGIAVDGQGNVYVADRDNNRIRKITSAGVVSTLAGDGVQGFADGAGSSACFNSPLGIAVDGQGNVYVADFGNNRIRKITSAGVVSTLAGDGTAGSTDGPGSSAKFYNPTGVAVDGQGNIYVADYAHGIRKIIQE